MKNEQDLAKEYQKYKPEITKAIDKVLSSGRYILGDEVNRFEQRFAEYTGAKYCVGVGSGYDALYLSYLIVKTKDYGHKVCVENELHQASTNAAIMAKKRIVPISLFADIVTIVHSKETNYCMDDYKGKDVIEDCCQALGIKIDGKHVGNFGLTGCFSFHPLKTLHCYGDGGAIITNDDHIYNQLLALRNHGKIYSGEAKQRNIGVNSRLDELQAAILNVFMDHIKELIND